jgi:phosphoglycerol transferase
MLLPIADHRAGLLARVRKAYDESYMPLVNENHTVSLGLTASIGLLVLLGRLLLWNKARSAPDLQAGLAMLAVVAILLATIGGFSALFSVYITPQIRCWNRINLYIGFFSLFSLALLYERSLRACGSSLLPRVALHVSLGVVLVLGVLDQTSRSFIPDYPSLVRQYQSDRAFVRRIEGSAPAGAMIFQLPYFPYPEGGPRVQLRNYESLKGYVHSCHLRWSHGAMKGREADDVIRGIAVLPLGQMVRALAVAGFSGIYLDRRGYTDHGAGIELELTRMLSAPPLVSEDGHRSYFSIIDFADVHRQNLSSAEWEAARQSVLYPVAVEFREGCHYGDDPPENPARWCAAAACLRLHNPRSQAQRVRLEMVCEAHQPQAHLALRGELLSRDYEIRDGRLVISEELTVPPGFHPLRLSCDAQRFPPTGDPRGLVFYLRSVVLRELP